MGTQLITTGLVAFLAGLEDAIDEGTAQAAALVGDLAQQLAPEDSGDLKASKRVVPGARPGVYEVRFGDGLPDERALAQEYGTVYSAAQPYLTPAVEAIDVPAEVKAALAALAARSRV